MRIELDVDVPESRTVTLPPEVGTGRVRVTLLTDGPDSVAPSALDAELAAFERHLPQLLASHPNQYAAFYRGGLIATGPDKLALARAAHRLHGNVPILVRRVAARQPVVQVRTRFAAAAESEA